MEKGRIPLMTQEQKTAFDELTAQWRRTKLLTVAIWAALTLCAAAAVYLTKLFGDSDFAECSVLTLLPASLVLLIIMAVQDSNFKKAVRAVPELDPQTIDPATKAFWQQADADYSELRSKLTVWQVLTVTAGLALQILLPVSLLLSIVIAVAVLPAALHIKGKRLLTPYTALDEYAETGSKRIGCGALLLLIFCIGLSALFSMNRSIAESRRDALNSSAESVYKAAVQWTADCEEQGITVKPGTYIGCQSDEATEKTSLAAAMKRYYAGETDDWWYAVKIDGSGKVTRAFYKCSAMTETDLTPMSPEEQRELLASLFHRKKTVGYYIPEETE